MRLDSNATTASGPREHAVPTDSDPNARSFDGPARPIGDPPTPLTRRDRPSLLVVDDEPDVLRSVHDLLRLDYRVITRGSGAAALDVLRSAEDVHVVMSDQRMPGMSGVELLRQARAIRPETTRLLFTAHADIRSIIDAINEGHIFRYIAKPWDPDELAAVVRQAVERHDLIVEKNRLLAELQSANARLTEANRLKGAFLEVASHELNTPVSVLLGLIELRKMATLDASAADRQWLEHAGSAARRLARTVERMLKLVRSGDFDRPLERQPADVAPLIQGAVDELSSYLEIRRQAVAISIEPALEPIEVDADKVADVMVNLLANAIKFTPDGGTIRVAAASEPGWLRVSVSDDGPGVPADDQQYLFEPFFTGFDTLRHSSGDYQFGKRGLGLGLWLVKSFVELHGGRVELSSREGQGSTFTFLLPRPSPPGDPGAPQPSAD
ncbi:MAG: ATP-binding protein [Isosphaeraceae bacterium]